MFQQSAETKGLATPDPGEFTSKIKLIDPDDNEIEVHAMFVPMPAQEGIINDRLTTIARAKAVVRYSKTTANLKPTWTAEYDGNKYDIESVFAPWGTNKLFEIHLRAVV